VQHGPIGAGAAGPHTRFLLRLYGETQIIPAVNQIEVHPYLTQDDVRLLRRAPDRGRGLVAAGTGGVLGDPVIRSIAERTGKTAAQVVLRWHIQRGDIVFPKSVTPDRIRENIDIFDFELSAADVEDITVLNKNERTGPDPDKFDDR